MPPNEFTAAGLTRRSALGVAALGAVAAWCPAVAAAPVRPDPAAAEKQMEAWWADLEKGEAEASRALLRLADRPKEAVDFLKKKLKPLTIDAERVKALLAKLGSDREDVWKPAFEELEYFDPRLAIDLATLMTDVTGAPARQRMVALLSGRPAESLAGEKVDLRAVGQDGFNFFAQGKGSWWAEHKVSRINSAPWGNLKKKWTRATRAIILLEHIGTPEAVALLKGMATGHPEAHPTKEAKEALERVAGKAR
jgi:hypothetical protein